MREKSDGASPEFSVGYVAEKVTRVFFFALGIDLGNPCYFRPSTGLSVGGVDRAAKVGGQRASGLCTEVARVRERGSSPPVLSLVLSPVLSVGDVGEAVGGGVVLTPSLVTERVRVSVWGVASTVRYLAIFPRIIQRGRGESFCGCETRPGIISRGSRNLCAAKRGSFNVATLAIIRRGSGRRGVAILLSRFAKGQGRGW